MRHESLVIIFIIAPFFASSEKMEAFPFRDYFRVGECDNTRVSIEYSSLISNKIRLIDSNDSPRTVDYWIKNRKKYRMRWREEKKNRITETD